MIVKVVKVNKNRGFAIIDMKEKDYGWIEIIDSGYLEEEDILSFCFDRNLTEIDPRNLMKSFR